MITHIRLEASKVVISCEKVSVSKVNISQQKVAILSSKNKLRKNGGLNLKRMY